MTFRTLWVAELRISERTATKIGTTHGLDPAEVRDALVCQDDLSYEWHVHPERGLRAIVEIRIGRVLTVAVLYPIGDDVYHLGSAYPLHS